MLPSSLVRKNLDRLIKASPRDGYASVSVLLGRNHAYIYQFIKRGTPRRLDEVDRQILADYFGVDETELGAPFDRQQSPRGLAEGRPYPSEALMVPFLDVRASAGAGSLIASEEASGLLPVDFQWLRNNLNVTQPGTLTAITVEGESMAPTLAPGDQLLVDCSQRDPRDGRIYVLRHQGALHVKRLRKSAKTAWRVSCDNPDHEGWLADPASETEIVGRVLWASRRL